MSWKPAQHSDWERRCCGFRAKYWGKSNQMIQEKRNVWWIFLVIYMNAVKKVIERDVPIMDIIFL